MKRKYFQYLIPLIIWLMMFSWKPFFLGFYHDDWSYIAGTTIKTTPFSFSRLCDFLALDSRSLAQLMVFFITSIIGHSIILWQWLISLLVLVLVYVLQSFFKKILHTGGFESKSDFIYIGIGSSLFLIFPWQVGTISSPTIGINIVATISFLYSAIAVLDFFNTDQVKKLYVSCLFFLFSCLIYEAYFFQYITILAFYFVHSKFRVDKKISTAFIALSVVQILAILYNRLYPIIFGRGIFKSFNANWFRNFIHDSANLHNILLDSYDGKDYLKKIFFVFFIVLFIYLFFKREKVGAELSRILKFVLPFFGGIIISVILYNTAGYSIQGTGYFSRTTIVISVYVFTLLTLLIIHIAKIEEKLPRSIALIFLTVFFLFSSWSYLTRTHEWINSFSEQKRILENAPVEQMKHIGDSAIVLVKGNYEYKGIVIFGAYWDITGAMNTWYPEIGSKKNTLFTILREKDWLTIWDGENFQQGQLINKEYINWKFKCKELYLWKVDSKEFIKLNAPFYSDKFIN